MQQHARQKIGCRSDLTTDILTNQSLLFALTNPQQYTAQQVVRLYLLEFVILSFH